MPLPTLLRKGYLIPQKWDNVDEANNVNPIDYIMKFFEKRTPREYKGAILLKPKSYEDRIIIIRAGTASGKSTTIPPELYKRFSKVMRRGVACTQPRILNALSIPYTIAGIDTYKELFKIGDNLGYSTSISKARAGKGVKYMTIETLVEGLKNSTDEEFIKKYGFVVIDEAHERSKSLDTLMMLMKQLIKRNIYRYECPFLIIMSATLDIEKFGKYFEVPKNIYDVKGGTNPIISNYLKSSTDNFIQTAINTALKIHNENVNDYNSIIRDIIIFVSGDDELQMIKKGLLNSNSDNNPFLVLKLNRDTVKTGSKDFRDISAPIEALNLKNGQKPNRRIIISTSVAETGVTIETLKYVIDCGWGKSPEFFPNVNVKSLTTKPVTEGRALQRKGRVGRKAEGYWYPLYTKETFDKLQKDQFPEMLTTDITPELLNIIYHQLEKNDYFDLKDIDLLDPPSPDCLHYSMEKLYVMGAIKDNQLTKLGNLMYKFGDVSPEIVRMIMCGYAFKISIVDIITIGAFVLLETDRLIKNKDKYIKAHDDGMFGKMSYWEKQMYFADQFIEYIFIYGGLLDVLNKYMEIKEPEHTLNEEIKNWCYKTGLKFNIIMEFISKRDQLLSKVADNGFRPFKGESLYDMDDLDDIELTTIKIKKCIYEGFKLNLAIWNNQMCTYITHNTHLPIEVNTSFIKKDIRPKYILFDRIFLTQNRDNIMYNTKIYNISSLDGWVTPDLTFTNLNWKV